MKRRWWKPRDRTALVRSLAARWPRPVRVAGGSKGYAWIDEGTLARLLALAQVVDADSIR